MRFLAILQLLSTLALSSAFAAPLTVKVTGGGNDIASGYYVEYTINGNKYRSDEVGERINDVAWANMSAEDKKKTMGYFTFDADRYEQFGKEFGIQMGREHNAEWINAAEILTTKLVERDYKGLTERFSDSESYFQKNFLPKSCTVEELEQFAETKKLYAAEREIFSLACAAYAAMREAEYRRTQVATKSAAGDLISLICDKALVPNITPSGALSGAAAIGQKIFAEALEYADKASGYCDKAVAMLAGQRVTADMATEVITAMSGTIDCQYEIIKRALADAHDVQNQIDAAYPKLKEAANQAEQAAEQQRQAAVKSIEDVPTEGAPDAAIVAETALKQQAVDSAAAERAKFEDSDYCAAHGGYEGKQAAQQALEKAQAAKIAYNQEQYDGIQSRYLSFKSACATALADDVANEPQSWWNPLTDYNAKLLFWYGMYPTEITDSELAAMKSDISRQHQERRECAEARNQWQADGVAKLIELRQAYCDLSTDWDALSFEGVVREDDDFGTGGASLLEGVERLSRVDGVSYENEIAEENAKLDDFIARRSAYQDEIIPAAAKSYDAGLKLYTDAVAEYDAAWQELYDVLDTLPSYVKSQPMCNSGLVVKESSELAQKFLADGATGTLADALAVRSALTSCARAYRKAKRRIAVAEASVTAYAGAFDTGGFSNQQFSNYGNGSSVWSKKFKNFADVSKSYSVHSIPAESASCPRALEALERDFNNYTYAHTTMIDQLGDFVANYELYSTNVLDEAEDPYVRRAAAARYLSVTPKSYNYETPASILMPGYYLGYGKTAYEAAILEAADCNRGTCSYTYFIKGYAAAVGNIVSDPYDDYIKPLLNEIDAARAAASGKPYDPYHPDEPDEPDPEDPDDSPKVATVGQYVSLELQEKLGIAIDADYAAGDKVAVKVEGLAKGLKLVTTAVYVDPTAKKKVVKDYTYTIEGVPTESVDFATQPMYARVIVTKGKTKTETLQPIVLSIVAPEPEELVAGVLNETYEPIDIAELWPAVADAKVNPKDWTFKTWPTGLSLKNGELSGKSTKAGVYPMTATHKRKLADGKTTVSETYSATFTVWGDDGATDFRYTDQAYVETATKVLGATVTGVSGQPTGIKWTKALVKADVKKGTPEYPAYSLYGTPTKSGVFATTVTYSDKTKKTFLWKVTEGENAGFLSTMNWTVKDSAVTVMQGVIQTNWTCKLPADAKVTAKLPTGLKLAQDKDKSWTLSGTPTAVGDNVATFTTVRNGVTVTERVLIVVEPNEWTGIWYGLQYNDQDASLMAEVTVSANGTVKLVYTEGTTNVTAKGVVSQVTKATVTVKNLDANGTTATLVLPRNKKDPLSVDRRCVADFKNQGLDVYGPGPTVSMDLGERVTDGVWPDVMTAVLNEYGDGETNAYAYVTATYNAKNATFALAGKLWDGTAIKGTAQAVAGDNISPVMVVDKAKNAVTIGLYLDSWGRLCVRVYENGKAFKMGWTGNTVLAGKYAAADLKSKKFSSFTDDKHLYIVKEDGTEMELKLTDKDMSAALSAQGLVKFMITDADGWKWACEMLVTEMAEPYNGIATGTKKNSPTRYRPVHSAELPD